MKISDDPGVRQLIELAKQEDLGPGDITSELLPDPAARAEFQLLMKSPGVFCGREIAEAVAASFDSAIHIDWTPVATDGARFGSPTALASLRGPLGSILAAERTLLNFLQRLCGVTTLTRAFVDAVSGTQAAIYDTRKTVPGWRALDKYAVRCGGGRNHRMGLHDAVLIKDNHLTGIEANRLGGAVFEMLNRLAADRGSPAIEVEAPSLAQFEELLKVVGVQVILLDNFRLADLAEAVRRRDAYGLGGKIELEASGGVTLENVREIAATGVERISVGAITHSVRAIDLCLERV